MKKSEQPVTEFAKTSNTGQEESPAKHAPMSSKNSELLGGETTTDAVSHRTSHHSKTSDLQATARQAASHPKK